MLNANRNPAAPSGCGRLAIESVAFMVVWSAVTTAIFFINHHYGQADTRELAIPVIALGPIFWFILCFVPRKSGRRRKPDSDET